MNGSLADLTHQLSDIQPISIQQLPGIHKYNYVPYIYIYVYVTIYIHVHYIYTPFF